MKTEQQKPYWLPCPRCKEKTDVKIHENLVPLHIIKRQYYSV